MGTRITMTGTVLAGIVLVGTGCGQSDRPALAWGTPAADAEDGRGAPPAAGGLAPRRVWTGDFQDFYLMSVSPDRRYVTWKDWSTSNLTVHDLETGDYHPITASSRGSGTSHEGATSVFSRDGRQIAYAWEAADPEWTADVRIVDFESDGTAAPRVSEPRVIYQNPFQYPYYLWDWSPDGRWVLGKLYGPDRTVAIALFSTAGSTARILKTFDWREPLRAAFSPDGRFVAYDLPSASDRRSRRIFVASVDGTQERMVVGGDGHHRLFGWDADDGIVYVTQHGSAPSLWRQPMAEGLPAGAPTLLRKDFWRAEPIGFSGRSMHYGVAAEVPTARLATLDLETGQLASAPRPLDDGLGGDARSMAWSLDGNYLAVIYRDAGQRGRRLAIRSADGTPISDLPVDLEPWFGRLRWFPDGRSVMVFGPDDKGRRGFYRIHLGSGAVHTVLRGEVTDLPAGHFDLSRDGIMYYTRFVGGPGGPSTGTVIARTLATGDERPIGSARFPAPLAVSPDGSEIAVLAPSADPDVWVVGVLPATGGSPREVFRLSGRWRIGAIHWTPGGDYVLFVAMLMEHPWTSDVWLVPVHGGEARKLDPILADWRTLTLHPDGRRVAFKTGGSRGEIWTLELGEPQTAARADRTSP